MVTRAGLPDDAPPDPPWLAAARAGGGRPALIAGASAASRRCAAATKRLRGAISPLTWETRRSTLTLAQLGGLAADHGGGGSGAGDRRGGCRAARPGCSRCRSGGVRRRGDAARVLARQRGPQRIVGEGAGGEGHEGGEQRETNTRWHDG